MSDTVSTECSSLPLDTLESIMAILVALASELLGFWTSMRHFRYT